jgi:hypothetical protein
MSVELPPPPPPVPPPAPIPVGWEGILEEGEQILWQGAPDPRVVFTLSQIPEILFGLFFAGFALFWTVMATYAGGIFGLFGLPFLAVGLMVIFKSNYLLAYLNRYTHYTLTSRRAIIATSYPYAKREMKSYPIDPKSELELTLQDELGSIVFHRKIWRSRNSSDHTKNIGFYRIQDARRVFSLMRQIQQEAR